jgi:hypothetical protein
MSEEITGALPPDWTEKLLTSLRRQLEEGAVAPPEWMAQLLRFLRQPATSAPLDAGDLEMLSLILNDLMAGVDIAERYPAFYARLLSEPRLADVFLDALEMLDETAEETEESLPISRDLFFLQDVKPPVVLEQLGPGQWRAAWQLLRERLRWEFSGEPGLVYRSGPPLLEDQSYTLVEDAFEAGGITIQLLLEAIRPLAEPGVLRPQLFAATQAGPLPQMQASVTWGRYAATAVPDNLGQARFPLVPLDAVLDESGQFLPADFQLLLEFLPG